MVALAAAGAVASGLGYLVSVWPAPEPFRVPYPAPEPVQIMTMSGGPDQVGGDDDRCLWFLDEWVRHPSWEVTVTRGASGCTGSHAVEQITVDSQGDAIWTAPNRPSRVMHLSPAQLAGMHAAATRSCKRERTASYSVGWVEVHWGGPEAPSRRAYESDATDQLEAFLDDAIASYRDRRIAERADFHATVILPVGSVAYVPRPVRVTVAANGGLALRVGRRQLDAPRLSMEDTVDVIDWIELDGADPDRWHVPSGLARAIDHATYEAGLQR